MPRLISREQFKELRDEEYSLEQSLMGIIPVEDIDTSISREEDYVPRFVYNRTRHPRPKEDSEANIEQESLNSPTYGVPFEGWMLELRHNYDFELSIGEIRAIQNYRIKKRIEPIVLERFGNKCCLTGSSFCTIVDPTTRFRRESDRLPLEAEHYIVLNIKLAEAYQRGLFWFDDSGRLTFDEYTIAEAVEFFGLDTSLVLPNDLPNKTKELFFTQID